MKKRIIFAIAAFLISSSLSAQFVKPGLKTGLNFNRLSFDAVENITSAGKEYSISQDANFSSFHIGLMLRINIFKAFIQPELYFNTSGGKILIEETQGAIAESFVRSITYNKIDLPVLVGGKLSFLRIYAGPVTSYVLSTDSEIEEIIPEMETLSKNFTIGYQAGTGFDLLKTLTIDFRYEGGLSKLGDKFSMGTQDFAFDARTNKFMLSLGIFF